MTEGNTPKDYLWQLKRESYLTKVVWTGIIKSLVKSLSEFLATSVELNEMSAEDICDGDIRVIALVHSAKPFGGPLSVAWQGALAVELHEDRPYVSASLFLFCLGKRLSVADHKMGSYVELIHEPTSVGSGQWRVLGWLRDTYGEYEDIDECSAYD